jgi:hypothetical protein
MGVKNGGILPEGGSEGKISFYEKGTHSHLYKPIETGR